MAAPQRRKVVNTYSEKPQGGGSCCSWKRAVFLGVALTAVIVLFGGEDDSSKVKSKQLRVSDKGTKLTTPPSAVNKVTTPIAIPKERTPFSQFDKVDEEEDEVVVPKVIPQKDNDAKASDEETLDETIDEAIMDLDLAEESEIDANKSMLSAALQKANDFVKFGLGRLFGDSDDVEEEELEEIAQEVAKQLSDEVQAEFKKKADKLTDVKVDDIKGVAEEDEDAGTSEENIRSDVLATEKIDEEDLKDEIDEAAEEVKETIKEKAAKIEKEVIEKRLKKKVKIVDGKVEKEDTESTKKKEDDDEDTKKTSTKTVKDDEEVTTAKELKETDENKASETKEKAKDDDDKDEDEKKSSDTTKKSDEKDDDDKKSSTTKETTKEKDTTDDKDDEKSSSTKEDKVGDEKKTITKADGVEEDDDRKIAPKTSVNEAEKEE